MNQVQGYILAIKGNAENLDQEQVLEMNIDSKSYQRRCFFSVDENLWNGPLFMFIRGSVMSRSGTPPWPASAAETRPTR